MSQGSDNRGQLKRRVFAGGKVLTASLCLMFASESQTSARSVPDSFNAANSKRSAATGFQLGPQVPASHQGTRYRCVLKQAPETTPLPSLGLNETRAATLSWGGSLATRHWAGLDAPPLLDKTSCATGAADLSVMWMPAPTDAKGLAAAPETISVAYSAPYGPANAMPHGLQMLASRNTEGFDGRHRLQTRNTGKGLTVTAEFPSCVAMDLSGQPILGYQHHDDGQAVNSHVAYAIEGCPASHPYRIPTVTYDLQYPALSEGAGIAGSDAVAHSPLQLAAVSAGYIAAPSDDFNRKQLRCGHETRACRYGVLEEVRTGGADLAQGDKPPQKSLTDPSLAKPKGPLAWPADNDDETPPTLVAGYPFDTKVIHSGHSLTDAAIYEGGWPGHWTRLIADQLQVPRNEVWPTIAGKSTIPGSLISWRWENTSSPVDERRDIADFEVMVITERVPLSSFVDSNEWLRTLAEHAWNNGNGGAGAETFLYTTWTNIDDRDGGFRERLESDALTWEAMADYASENLPYQIRIVPGHRLMMRLYDDSDGDIAQYFEDTIHPNDVGAYALAMLHMAVIYRFDPRGHDHTVTELDLTAEQASYLQQVAWEVANSYARTGL